MTFDCQPCLPRLCVLPLYLPLLTSASWLRRYFYSSSHIAPRPWSYSICSFSHLNPTLTSSVSCIHPHQISHFHLSPGILVFFIALSYTLFSHLQLFPRWPHPSSLVTIYFSLTCSPHVSPDRSPELQIPGANHWCLLFPDALVPWGFRNEFLQAGWLKQQPLLGHMGMLEWLSLVQMIAFHLAWWLLEMSSPWRKEGIQVLCLAKTFWRHLLHFMSRVRKACEV